MRPRWDQVRSTPKPPTTSPGCSRPSPLRCRRARPRPDLRCSGRSATYTLAYRNDGPSTATDIVLADQIPDGLEFSAAPGCSLVGAGPVFVTCAVDPLGPGGSGQVEITFLVADSAVDGATILNAASIVAAGTESDQADNSSVVSGLVDTEPPGGTSEQPSGSGRDDQFL